MDHVATPGRIALGDFVLDIGDGTLTRTGRVVEMRAKPFRLLCHLARHPGRVLSKDALLDAVWPEVTVTEDSLTQAIRDIRLTLGAEAAAMLRTVPRRGYMFDPGPPPEPESGRLRLPRVAVAPIGAAGLAPEAAAVPELLRDALLGGLARFRSLHVIGGTSAGPDAADHRIEGLVWSEPGGPILRLKLIDVGEDRIVWSDTFPCGPAPGPGLETVRHIVGALHAAIEFEAELRSARRGAGNLTAWEHFARGLSVCGETRPDVLDRAAAALEAATRADPGFGLAWSVRAQVELARHDFLMAPADVIERVRQMSELGASLAPDEARAISMLGYVQLMQSDFAGAEARIAHAYRLNPCSMDVLIDKALVALCRGRPAECLSWLDRAEAMQPMRPAPHPAALRGDALYHLGRYDEALAAFLAISDLPPRRQLWVAAALAMAGRPAEARARLAAFRAAMPGADPLDIARRTYVYEHEADSRHLLDGIALALREG